MENNTTTREISQDPVWLECVNMPDGFLLFSESSPVTQRYVNKSVPEINSFVGKLFHSTCVYGPLYFSELKQRVDSAKAAGIPMFVYMHVKN